MRAFIIIALVLVAPAMAFMPVTSPTQDPMQNDTVRLADTFSNYLSDCVPNGWTYEVIKEAPPNPKYYKQPIFTIKYSMEALGDTNQEQLRVHQLRKTERTYVTLHFYFKGDPKLIEQEIYLRQNEHYGVQPDIPKRFANSAELTCFYVGKPVYTTPEQERVVMTQYINFLACLKEVIRLL